jgi:hypothetical protein
MVTAAGVAQPGYRPRSPTNPLKQVVGDYYEELLKIYDARFASTYGALHPRLKDLFEEFLRCGDPHFGFLRLRCLNPDCPEKGERIVPFSCKGRGLCPSCGMKRAIAWAERMVEEVLPDVSYVQLVFTIPKMLRKGFLFDRSLYGELCRAAYASTEKFFQAQFPGIERAVPAMVVAPQSFGSLLNVHPHCHAVSSLGVFSRDGIFHPAPEDLDFSALETLFREEVFRVMLKKEAITAERIELLRSWKHSGFHVNADRRVAAGERRELESVLQYMVRPPVALSRLQYLNDGRILYRGNYNPTLGTDHQLLSALEFLALLVPHVILRYECRIFCYGAISTTIRRALGWVKKDGAAAGPGEVVVAEEDESGFVRLRRRSWARLIARTYLENPELCPHCKQPMKVLAAISSPAQDDVIEAILRARGEWDPPWKHQRKARGPPPGVVLCPAGPAADEGCSQVRPEREEDFDQQVPEGDQNAGD